MSDANSKYATLLVEKVEFSNGPQAALYFRESINIAVQQHHPNVDLLAKHFSLMLKGNTFEPVLQDLENTLPRWTQEKEDRLPPDVKKEMLSALAKIHIVELGHAKKNRAVIYAILIAHLGESSKARLYGNSDWQTNAMSEDPDPVEAWLIIQKTHITNREGFRAGARIERRLEVEQLLANHRQQPGQPLEQYLL